MSTEAACLSRSPEETRAIAEALAPTLAPGDIVALSGDLGAGKTCFVQGAARALGVEERVTSPSFVLVREYEGRVPVAHVDVYRLINLQQLIDLGYEELLDPHWVVFIEWGRAVDALLPTNHLEVEIRAPAAAPLDGDGERTITFRAHGPRWGARLGEIAERTADWKA